MEVLDLPKGKTKGVAVELKVELTITNKWFLTAGGVGCNVARDWLQRTIVIPVNFL